MSYLTEVYKRLRAARDASPANELRALARRILDEHRPGLAAVSAGSENSTLYDVRQGLETAAQDFLDAANALDQVTEKINAYVGDVFLTGSPPTTPCAAQDREPAERSVSVPHPARGHAPDGIGEALDHALTKDWAVNIARRLPERVGPRDRTTGLGVLGDGSHVEVVSGGDQDAVQAELILVNASHFPRPRSQTGGFDTAKHVETKIAYRMREQGITYAAVVINNEICDGVYGCTYAVPAILPRGYTLVVWEPGATKPIRLRGKAQP
ncbi:hypothetical protein NLX83_25165 [Allokutzneria sp. A3M-2-11 16]|uniref:DddA-like double-stranded DNA deaminase toxin n=1 Tax=Allokutzneria sp. A3M-2-11 16 TaxID=2962043 RepID=UPI0020B8D7C6|nr:DddA-like double-stranded DNA deaminase toxin [Allokutzneria sp. A3M-2-11 16]MCP3802566.1 hypothetical protein [Allokutzneria sp. A3M-2-11 16]